VSNPPTDNAFEDYQRAAGLLQARGVQPAAFLHAGFSPALRRKLVHDNQDVLRIAHQAAAKECAVPADVARFGAPGPNPANWFATNLDPRMEVTRKLTRFLQVTVQEQADAGQPVQALETGNDLVAMGVGFEHGTIVWALDGLSCEDAAVRTMDEPAERVGGALARNAARRLSELDRQAPPFSEIQAADDYYWPKPRVLSLSGGNPFRQFAQGAEADLRGCMKSLVWVL
jgi:hypothetical protein